MNLLRPGYIPDGWTLGDNVHVVEARRDKPGAIVHAPQSRDGSATRARSEDRA